MASDFYTAAKAMELSAMARTILTQRGSETSDALLKQLCPQCYPMMVVRDNSVPLKTVSRHLKNLKCSHESEYLTNSVNLK
jgi:hypothetical protein